MRKIHRLTQRRESITVKALIDSGLVRTFVEILSSANDRELQIRVASILLFITAGSSEQTPVAIDAGALPLFVNIASSSKDTVLQNKALLALGNIASDSPQLRERVIKEGGLKPPLDILANPSKYLKSTVYWAANAVGSYTHSSGGEVLEEVVCYSSSRWLPYSLMVPPRIGRTDDPRPLHVYCISRRRSSWIS